MNAMEIAASQLDEIHGGPAWHGPSVREALSGVDAARAAARPQGGAHSIWELVQHLTAWEDVCLRRLEGEVIDGLPPAEDFPEAGKGEPAWRALLDRFDRVNRQLQDAIRRFPESRLEETVPAKDYTFATMLHGVACHSAYHGGQMALIRKLPAP